MCTNNSELRLYSGMTTECKLFTIFVEDWFSSFGTHSHITRKWEWIQRNAKFDVTDFVACLKGRLTILPRCGGKILKFFTRSTTTVFFPLQSQAKALQTPPWDARYKFFNVIKYYIVAYVWVRDTPNTSTTLLICNTVLQR